MFFCAPLHDPFIAHFLFPFVFLFFLFFLFARTEIHCLFRCDAPAFFLLRSLIGWVSALPFLILHTARRRI
ncbi:hypothetical protein DFJ73DRAFT_829820, partial [Zopfochytrium polystomum]